MRSRIDVGVLPIGTADVLVIFERTVPVEIAARPIVPEVVIVPPVTPLFVATDVTVPVPETEVHDGFAAAPPVVRTWPLVPGARATQLVEFL
jgi:hypothetical protein